MTEPPMSDVRRAYNTIDINIHSTPSEISIFWPTSVSNSIFVLHNDLLLTIAFFSSQSKLANGIRYFHYLVIKRYAFIALFCYTSDNFI